MLLKASIVIFLVGLFHLIVPSIFFAIKRAHEIGHFTPLGQTAIVCYSLSWVYFLYAVFPLLPLLSPVSTILIIIDRIHQHEFYAITKAYVAIAFGGLRSATFYAILWDMTLMDWAYKRGWLRSKRTGIKRTGI